MTDFYIKKPFATSHVALNGTTNATLVPAPPDGVAYRILRVFGTNTSGGTRTLTLYVNKAAAVSKIWVGSPAGTGVNFVQTAGAEVPAIEFYLAATNESLEMDLDDTGTDIIVACYEILEAE